MSLSMVARGCVLYLCCVTGGVWGFNVDTSHAVVHEGTRGTYFGYSIAQLNDQNGAWVVVGAPKSTRRRYESGDVWRCRTDRAEACTVIDGFHTYTVQTDSDLPQWDLIHRKDQWLGATVVASEATGHIVACAPRMWFHVGAECNAKCHGNLAGGCFSLDQQSGTFTRYDPCINATAVALGHLHVNEGRKVCSAGVDAIFNKNGNRLFMSAPGSYHAQGQLVSHRLGSKEIKSQTNKISGPELSWGYMGMSLQSGQFSDGNYQDYIAGAPRVDLTGRVIIYNKNLSPSGPHLEGGQLGEYFGHSLAVGDFNADGNDDVVVGAPFYSDYEKRKSDIGRVVVYYQNSQHEFPSAQTLPGPEQHRGRFGYSLANAQDLNMDGYQDLVVGAPYAGEDNTGAVYVFYGSEEGLRKDYLQVIQARDFKTKASRLLSTFGHSLSAGVDQDGNGYTDIAVGAYESSHVVHLRSRPIVSPSVTVTADLGKLDLERMDCTDRQTGMPVTCFNITTCIEYTGHRTPPRLYFNVMWTLDGYKERRNKRVGFSDLPGEPALHTETVEAQHGGRRACVRHRVQVKSDIRDKLSAIPIEVTFNINESRLQTRDITPIQDVLLPKQSLLELHILKYCGKDEVCVPDLQLQVDHSSLEGITIGQTDQLDVMLSVSNGGEDSYESRVYTQLPTGFNYRNVSSSSTESTVTCSAKTNLNGSIVICDLGNPMPSHTTVHFTLRASIMVVDFHSDSISITFLTNSTNPEDGSTLHDNEAEVDLQVRAQAELAISGVSVPEQILYNASSMSEETEDITDLGPTLTHLYQVVNRGPSNMSAAVVEIYWPALTAADADLLYLTASPCVLRADGRGRAGECTATHVNPKHLQIPSNCSDAATLGSFSSSFFSRSKRSSGPEELSSDESEEHTAHLACTADSVECVLIRCEVGSITAEDSVFIQVNSRVVLDTFSQLYGSYDSVIVSSMATVTLTELPYSTTHYHNSTDTAQALHTPTCLTMHNCVEALSRNIETLISATDQAKSSRAPIWIIIVATVSGLILLVIVAAVLKRCGFFKRKKKEDLKRLTVIAEEEDDDEEEETQPLNAEQAL